MTTNEKWNKIVALHKQYLNSPESKVQNVWESVFVEILGYSRLEGEVERHRNIQLGSTERVIPDIIVKNNEKDLFIVELKQHNIPFQMIMEAQLFSYLKQLRNDIGILVCDKLYIYSFDYAKRDDAQLKWQISFTENNPDGIEFVEKFGKGSFNARKIKTLVLDKNRFNINVEKIIEKMNPIMISKLLKENLQNNFSDAEIEEALKQLSIIVTRKGRPIIAPITTQPPVVGDRSRGKFFSFEKCRIPKGAILEYIKDKSITCTVYDDRKVEYQGQPMYMTSLVKLLTGSDASVAGPMFFTYNGKSLQEYYKEYQVGRTSIQPIINVNTVVEEQQNNSKITKADAIRLFNQSCIAIPKQCTFASLNKNGQYYWANPDISVLQNDWWFILNDTKNRRLYCFMVPGNTYHYSQFTIRGDRNQIDFEVIYGAINFTDKRSKIDFKNWLIKEVTY